MSKRRIAKNTALLYFRMILIMLVSLFTVRIILKSLGVIDYGIYNVVGGIVTMLSFLTGTMSSASQRFFAFELGRENYESLNKIFSATVNIYIIISIIILVIAETLGLWFLNNKMNIPADRIIAANWVYQFSILSFLASIIAIPYTSSIIAYEKMEIYAYVSIVEVFCKLLVVLLLVYANFDKLILYSFLMFFITLLVSIVYRFICVRKFDTCNYRYSWNKKDITPILTYASWNMIGAVAYLLKINGSNILLNIFFGPAINAARGIAFQVNSALSSFMMNFYMAVRPSITKAYSANDLRYFMQLVFQSSKFSYYLLFILSMPLLIETEYILELWLGEVPTYANIFTKLFIINILIESINNQLVAALQASGRIKIYQLIVSTMQLSVLPISFILLKMGAFPETVMYVSILVAIITFIPQLLITKKTISLSICMYLKDVVFYIVIVSAISLIIPLMIHYNMDYGIERFIVVTLTGIFTSFLTIYLIGLSKGERNTALIIIKNKINNLNR